jgi:3',5'-cyclic AMP phosphodiesterase CpdA
MDARGRWVSVAVVVCAAAASLGLLGCRSTTDPTTQGVRDEEPAPLVRIAAAGDTGTGDENQRRVVRAMVEHSQGRGFDALVLLGDLVYDVGDADRVDRAVTIPFAPVVDEGAELIPALGNHDIVSDEQDEILQTLGRDSSYYVDRVGPVRIVVLDSNVVNHAQTRWLVQTLTRRPSGVLWTVVAMHHPPYSAGYHGSSMDVRQAWSPLFARYDVDLVLAGHDHDYQRSHEIEGVTYVVSGGGGAPLRETGSAEFTAVSRSVWHFLDMWVYPDRIVVRAVDHAGELVDSFSVN